MVARIPALKQVTDPVFTCRKSFVLAAWVNSFQNSLLYLGGTPFTELDLSRPDIQGACSSSTNRVKPM